MLYFLIIIILILLKDCEFKLVLLLKQKLLKKILYNKSFTPVNELCYIINNTSTKFISIFICTLLTKISFWNMCWIKNK